MFFTAIPPLSMNSRFTPHVSSSVILPLCDPATLTSATKALGFLEMKFGAESEHLLLPTAKACGAALASGDVTASRLYAADGLRVAKANDDREWQAFFLRRLAVSELTPQGRENRARGAVDVADRLKPTAAGNACVESLVAAASACLRAKNDMEASHFLARAASLTSDSAKMEELSARVLQMQAVTYSRLGRFSEAEAMARNALNKLEALIFKEHQTAPDSKEIAGGCSHKNGLSQDLSDVGRTEIDIRTQTYKLLEATLQVLRDVLVKRESSESSEVGNRLLKHVEQRSGVEHSDVAIALTTSIEETLNEALPEDVADKLVPNEHEKWLTKRKLTDDIKRRQLKKTKAGLALAERAQQICIASFGPVSLRVAAAMGQKVELLSRLGQHDAAVKLQGEVLSILQTLSGPEDPILVSETKVKGLVAERASNRGLIDGRFASLYNSDNEEVTIDVSVGSLQPSRSSSCGGDSVSNHLSDLSDENGQGN